MHIFEMILCELKIKHEKVVFESCLLSLAGLHIVYTRDEVDIIQNLMFYIEAAYKVAVCNFV